MALGKALHKNKSTRQLVLSENALGKKGWQALADGLADNAALEALELANCDVDRVSLAALCDAVSQCAALQLVCLLQRVCWCYAHLLCDVVVVSWQSVEWTIDPLHWHVVGTFTQSITFRYWRNQFTKQSMFWFFVFKKQFIYVLKLHRMLLFCVKLLHHEDVL